MTEPVDESNRTVAAIDCGTNSIRLLIADPADGGGLIDRDRRTEIVRLGQGVDATGEFHPDALARTFAAVDAYAELITAAGVPTDRIHFVATSASRDAKNRDAFFDGVRERLGVLPDVISGDREAQLSFTGALSRVRPEAGPVLVMDIGGGSTEFIVGTATAEMTSAISLNIGSVRVTERFLKTSPPTVDELAEAEAYVDGLLDRSDVPFGAIGSWIGVAGTATTLAGVYLQLAQYDRAQVHGSTIPRAGLDELLARLSRLTVAEIRALPSMHPGRADVITGGTLIATRVAARTPVPEMIISESDILDGIALELLGSLTLAECPGGISGDHRGRARPAGHHRPDGRGVVRVRDEPRGLVDDPAAGAFRDDVDLRRPGRARGTLDAALTAALDASLSVSVLAIPDEADRPKIGSSYLVTVHGADRLGIVARLASTIAAAGGNITDLTTRLAGELYVLLAEVDLPPAADVPALQAALAQASAELGVDTTLRPVENDEL